MIDIYICTYSEISLMYQTVTSKWVISREGFACIAATTSPQIAACTNIFACMHILYNIDIICLYLHVCIFYKIQI